MNSPIDTEKCKSCLCNDCVFDYGLAVDSEYGSCLCKDTCTSFCAKCKSGWKQKVTQCEYHEKEKTNEAN